MNQAVLTLLCALWLGVTPTHSAGELKPIVFHYICIIYTQNLKDHVPKSSCFINESIWTYMNQNMTFLNFKWTVMDNLQLSLLKNSSSFYQLLHKNIWPQNAVIVQSELSILKPPDSMFVEVLLSVSVKHTIFIITNIS